MSVMYCSGQVCVKTGHLSGSGSMVGTNKPVLVFGGQYSCTRPGWDISPAMSLIR